MKNLKTALLLAIFCSAMQAQTPSPLTEHQSLTTGQPSFPGGEEMLVGFFQENLRYPSLAMENGVEGEVGLRLTLLENGEIGNIKVVNPLGFGCDEEAVRLVLVLPSWHPAILDGRPVISETYLKIRFRLL